MDRLVWIHLQVDRPGLAKTCILDPPVSGPPWPSEDLNSGSTCKSTTLSCGLIPRYLTNEPPCPLKFFAFTIHGIGFSWYWVLPRQFLGNFNGASVNWPAHSLPLVLINHPYLPPLRNLVCSRQLTSYFTSANALRMQVGTHTHIHTLHIVGTSDHITELTCRGGSRGQCFHAWFPLKPPSRNITAI